MVRLVADSEELLDVTDGLGVAGVQHGVQACLSCSLDVVLVVVEERHLGRRHAQTRADEGVAARIGLAQAALVGVDELVDQVLEAVGGLLALPGADEAVAEDPGPVARAQPAAYSISSVLGVPR